MAVAFVTSAKQETSASPCVVTISPNVDDYLIAGYCNDIASAVTWTFGSPLTQTFSGTSTADAMDAAIGAGKAGSGITSISTSVSADFAIGLIASFSGVHTTTPNDATPVTGSDSNNDTSGRVRSITTSTNGAMLVYAAALDVGSTSNPTVTMSDDAGGLTWNTVYAYESGGFRKLAISYALMPTAGAVNVTMTPSLACGFVGVLYALKPGGPAAPVLSSPTPSGTINTTTSATVGCTTDTTSGTLYAVIDTIANITGITASQVKAGQNNASASAIASGNSSVSGANPSVSLSGLTSGTSYGYALVQNDGTSDSNVLTGAFATIYSTIISWLRA